MLKARLQLYCTVYVVLLYRSWAAWWSRYLLWTPPLLPPSPSRLSVQTINKILTRPSSSLLFYPIKNHLDPRSKHPFLAFHHVYTVYLNSPDGLGYRPAISASPSISYRVFIISLFPAVPSSPTIPQSHAYSMQPSRSDIPNPSSAYREVRTGNQSPVVFPYFYHSASKV